MLMHNIYQLTITWSPILECLFQAEPSIRCAIIFLTHFADLSSWELAQKLKKKLPELQARSAMYSPIFLLGDAPT